MDNTLINALQKKSLYSHAVTDFGLIQTHLSWVILTGEYAYKIKKPLNLGFQDFTTLAKRKHYCELELSLNKRLAPHLYCGVIPISGSPTEPSINDPKNPIEYAIKMRQFKQENMLCAIAQNGKLNLRMIKSIAHQLAQFHQAADVASSDSHYGTPKSITAPMLDNFDALLDMPFTRSWHDLLSQMRAWTEQSSMQLTTYLQQRKQAGFTRATHGDVHLGNIVLINDKPVIFDCIEFNEDFRWTDTWNDVGFLFMDLCHKGCHDLAYSFINHYLEKSGDYEGLILLPFFACYRAMVRAKVMGFQMMQTDENTAQYQQLKQDLADFLELAATFTQHKQPNLTITVGISGTGKSSYTEKMMAKGKYIRLRSDVVRKQMFDLPIYEPTPESLKGKVYSKDTSEKVFQQLRQYAKLYLNFHHNVIIDATCIKKWQRDLFLSLANELNSQFSMLVFETNLHEIEKGIAKRQQYKQASDATLDIAKSQLEQFDCLDENEQSYAIMINKNDVLEMLETS